MKLDCIAFVNVAGVTLLTRTPFLLSSRMAAEVTALEANYGEKIYAIRSFIDKDCKEIAVEIITPASLLLENGANRARVEYWRPHTRALFPKHTDSQSVSKRGFHLLGVLITPEEQALRHAFDYTSGPGYRWNPGSGNSYASQVGDVFVMTSPSCPKPQAYVVESEGFNRITFIEEEITGA